MYGLIIALIIIASILMTLVVLVQNSKGGGLASNFQSSNQMMGVQKTADVLEKTTWILSIALLVLSILGSAAISSNKSGDPTSMEGTSIEDFNPAQAPQQAPQAPQQPQ